MYNIHPSPPSLPPSPPSPPLPSPLPLVTQQIHCPFQPKQSHSYYNWCRCKYLRVADIQHRVADIHCRVADIQHALLLTVELMLRQRRWTWGREWSRWTPGRRQQKSWLRPWRACHGCSSGRVNGHCIYYYTFSVSEPNIFASVKDDRWI